MHITVIYNQPVSSYYSRTGEEEAVKGVLTEASAVKGALLESGYQVACIPLSLPFEEARESLWQLKTDLVFNLFEGFPGYPETEADICQVLTDLGLPYTGCPPQALRLALNKAETKSLFNAGEIGTPGFQLLSPGTLSNFSLEFPCIIKPNSEDASHGITEDSVVNDCKEMETQIQKVTKQYSTGEALVEEYIDGREFNTTVTGNNRKQVLAISEIEFSLPPGLPSIITYAGKWEAESQYYKGTKPVCPAKVTENEKQRIIEIAEKACTITGCRGYARVDMRMDRQGRIYVLEVNPNPDISPDSGATLHANTVGMTYTEFIRSLVLLAMEDDDSGS
ncbi:MAG: ATP-grasp domain-containing protein [Dehalococcoidales bacterium]|nr:ATP-grasp domain-containing protein [Dehalococcoidales bacterium]